MPIFFESIRRSIPDDPRQIRPLLGLSAHPSDVCADLLKLAHHVLIAAIQVIDVVERGRALRAKGSDYKRSARANIGDRHRSTVERRWARYDRAPALHVDIRSQFAQLRHMLKAIFEN